MPAPRPPAAPDPPAEPRVFLCSYWPLCKTAGGRQAVLKYGLPPFVNGMSRREPDFEHARPLITASSRGRNFVPRLRTGDTVVYTTTKGRWALSEDPPGRPPHWRLVAVLEVIERFASHAEAAAGYRARGLALPSNCIVDGSPPLPVPLTLHHGRLHDDAWDDVCLARSLACPDAVSCVPRYVELARPAVVSQPFMLALFGTVPNTRTPPEISPRALDALLTLTDELPCPEGEASPVAFALRRAA